MAEENKSGASEALEKNVGAAHAIHGAIKTGKAVASITKGAAVGGPYGAVAGALCSNRKTAVKIVLVAGFLLLLPVLFILMLPCLIFGGFASGSTEPGQPPILNNDAAIMEIANDLSLAIGGILNEGLDDVLARIDADFAASGGDGKEIINPYAAEPMYNANLFIAQYCASKNQDYQSIGAADMENVLRSGKQCLYSFTRAEEERETTITDPKTGEETTTTELWMIYTIVYNGEDYLADQIFHLTDEQKSLSRDYAYNMSVFLGDGLFQEVADGTFTPGQSYEGVIFTDGVTPVVYFNQGDERWGDKPYGTDKIRTHGCGPTSMSIVVSTLTGQTVDPIQMSEWAYKNGYWCKGSGSYHSLIPGAAAAWNLPVEGCTASEPQRIVDALGDGKLVAAIMAKGHFTRSGHFIVLRGVTSEGKILVADPGSYKRTQQEWELSIILNEASRRAGAGGPFWIIG